MEITKDVKNTSQETSTEPVKDSTATAKAEESKKEDVTLAEDVSGQTVPYNRFREKVHQVRELERKYSDLRAEAENKIKETADNYQSYYESEISRVKRELGERKDENNDLLDYYGDSTSNPLNKAFEEQIGKLNSQIEKMGSKINKFEEESETRYVSEKIKELKHAFPKAGEEHILAIHKIKGWPLEDCAEYSHKYFEDNIKSQYDSMMAVKKEAARRPVMAGETRISLKPEEKPKTIADANKRFIEYMSGHEGG